MYFVIFSGDATNICIGSSFAVEKNALVPTLVFVVRWLLYKIFFLINANLKNYHSDYMMSFIRCKQKHSRNRIVLFIFLFEVTMLFLKRPWVPPEPWTILMDVSPCYFNIYSNAKQIFQQRLILAYTP